MGGRGALAMRILLAGTLLALQPCAFALNPSNDVNQYAHTAWKVREGFTRGEIISIAQTPDGYLWLGTEFGLTRFDGVKNVPWQPPADQHLPSNYIMSLLATRDGTLWIGTWNGLASWKDGKLKQYTELAGHFIFRILEDHEGTIWASGRSTSPKGGRLCMIRGGNVQCYGNDGTLGRGAFNLYEDSKGNLWLGVETGLWRWRPGPPKFYPLIDDPDGIRALAEDADGALLVGWNGGIFRFVDGETEAYHLPGIAWRFGAKRILCDRDGGLWIGTQTQGLLHVHQGRMDSFLPSDGLSGANINAFLEDREGSIWAATINGLDRFRNFAVSTLSVNQGLSNALVTSVLADRNESVWLSTHGGLNRWSNGQIETYRLGSGKLNDLPESLFQDDRGRIWVSTGRGIGYFEKGKLIPVIGVPGGNILSISQDTAGNLWVANEQFGLFRISPQSELRQIPWAALGHKDHASFLAADPLHGGLWIGFFLGGIAYFEDGQVRASYTVSDGLGEGRVGRLRFDPDGTVWAATEGGLSRLKNGRVATLTSKNGLPCDTVHWVIQDNDHSFWLYASCGLVRITRPELDAWTAAVDQNKDTKRTIQVTVFGSSDGVRSLAAGGHYSPQVARTSDGRIWFLPWDGVSIVDPRHLPFNKLPPPVHVEQVIADRKTYDATTQMRLPPLVRDLEIDYTALSLVAPEKIRFRYKLENWDRDWQDAGNRRQAVYGNLSPGNYRFRVMACNNSGVWNEAGTFLDFSVAPAYYQTLWFRLSCVFVFLALLAGLYQLRVRQLAGQFNLRLEERVNERTRIARDLHDTLLQSFQGLMLKFRVLAFLLPDRPAEARKMLEEVIEQARAAITEGRDAVHGLRSSMVATNDLAQAISTLGEQLNAGQAGQQSPDFRVHVEGAPREIVPLLRDDVYRIAVEALRNAFRHAHPRQIEVEIRYDQRQFRLRVRDDGKGIDPTVLAGDGQHGHYGLPGMHERAKLIGGKLDVWSELDSGTEIELTIPASVAYAESPVRRRLMFWRN
jgi:signal transduction histidine kinase/ligand-binding sensor domain-containing protein